MTVNLVYITTGSQAEARAIGRALIEDRLAACVNLIAGMLSLYRWEGRIQEDPEIVLIAKTTESRLAALIEKVKALHSYDCPCIVCVPVTGGNTDFLDWIGDEVASP
jgi:periplasmic divalent cation tolerance protein